MRPMFQFAALIPVVVFLTACSSSGPTDIGPITSSDPYEAVSGDATAMMPPGCFNIVRVEVRTLPPTTGQEVWLQARYRYSAPVERCTKAPRWDANRGGIVVDPKDKFRASIPRSHEQTVVTVTAPNRITGTLVF